MISPDTQYEIAMLIEESMEELAHLLQNSSGASTMSRLFVPNVWWNKAGHITGSVSVWSSDDQAEDTIDGVVYISLSSDMVTIRVDVCRSSGSILNETFAESKTFTNNDDLLDIVRNYQAPVVEALALAMQEASRAHHTV